MLFEAFRLARPAAVVALLMELVLAMSGAARLARACDLALVLAVDVSGSVDPREYRLQMEGLAAALREPEISAALQDARAALALVQWTGATRQDLSVPWTTIVSEADVDAFAAAVAASPRKWRHYSTAIGQALGFAGRWLDAAPVQCRRRVIDVSGDGRNNEGEAPETIGPGLAANGVVVNGLAIEGSELGLTDYYRQYVIAGPGAFVITADDFDDYPRAIRRKLAREILDPIVEKDARRDVASAGR